MIKLHDLLNYIGIAGICVMLTACSSSPMVDENNQVSPTKPRTNNKVNPTQANVKQPTTSNSKKSGGYYLDDGPADNAPQDIDSIADAVPRIETPLARANKPYNALGKSYTPQKAYQPFKQSGIASWYGKRYHGQKTASGEVYDMFAMTAAHTILPLPSYVRVTNPANGKSVILRVNDRGPFHADRIIDLSYAAAYKLRLANTGSGYVEIEAIDAANFLPSTNTTNQPVVAAAVNSEVIAQKNTQTNNNVGDAQYYVQAGAFKSDANAQLLANRIESLGLATDIGIAGALGKDGFYRVKLGPYTTRQEADNAAANIRKKLAITVLVVNQ